MKKAIFKMSVDCGRMGRKEKNSDIQIFEYNIENGMFIDCHYNTVNVYQDQEKKRWVLHFNKVKEGECASENEKYQDIVLHDIAYDLKLLAKEIDSKHIKLIFEK